VARQLQGCGLARETCDLEAARERHTNELRSKTQALESKLVAFGLITAGELNPRVGQLRYDRIEADCRRQENLRNLTHATNPATGQRGFDGILLPGD
jgi:hypothetical protein